MQNVFLPAGLGHALIASPSFYCFKKLEAVSHWLGMVDLDMPSKKREKETKIIKSNWVTHVIPIIFICVSCFSAYLWCPSFSRQPRHHEVAGQQGLLPNLFTSERADDAEVDGSGRIHRSRLSMGKPMENLWKLWKMVIYSEFSHSKWWFTRFYQWKTTLVGGWSMVIVWSINGESMNWDDDLPNFLGISRMFQTTNQ